MYNHVDVGVRGAATGLAGCCVSSAALAALAAPPLAPSARALLAAVAAQGLCSGVAFGASYALAALAASPAPTLALTLGAPGRRRHVGDIRARVGCDVLAGPAVGVACVHARDDDGCALQAQAYDRLALGGRPWVCSAPHSTSYAIS